MVATINHSQIEEAFLAQVTELAYQAVLRQGLSRPFVDVELDLWQQIRAAYRTSKPETAVEER